MAGIRVITYNDSESKCCKEIIKKTFELFPQHSIDKSEELGVDRVGYRSIHCVGTLGKDRIKLPENKQFQNMVFEIQIRSILQHAWAEFEHDKNYKFQGVLKKDLQRRFSIIAGTLELLDREFDRISKAIDDYSQDVQRKTEEGDLEIQLDSTSLTIYMYDKFENLVEKEHILPTFHSVGSEIIEELEEMGIDTLEKLDKIVPNDFVKKYTDCYKSGRYKSRKSSFAGIIRNILIIYDIDTYFKKAWKQKWRVYTSIGYNFSKNFYKKFGIDYHKYAIKYNFVKNSKIKL